MLNELGISGRQVARYALLPQIFPRLKNFLSSGFITLPYCILVLFNTLRIIPDSHPYFRPENSGTFSTLKVIALAANNITFDRKNIDKIAVFFVVIGGLVMMALQFLLLIAAMFAAPAYAYNGPGLGPRTYGAFFDNANPKEDIAFRMLDLVFGIPGIFDSKNVGVTPFHEGLHTLFAFYSYGILLVGVFVIIYLVAAIVMETASSGVPFGQRFNKAWAPVRLIMFFGLLLPTQTYGINLGQYLVLNSAKWGSNLATNAWLTFDRTTKTPYIGKPEQLVAKPNTPDLNDIVTFMAVARTCSWAEGRNHGYDIKPYMVYGAGAAQSEELGATAPAFKDMVTKAGGGDVSIRFGVKDETLYPKEPGAVYPFCGELGLDITDQSQPGVAIIQQAYVQMISCLWDGNGSDTFECNVNSLSDQGRDFTIRYSRILPNENAFPNMDPYIGPSQKTQYLILMDAAFTEAINNAVTTQVKEGLWNNDAALNLGWGGAGIWFNKIAEQNGALTGAIYDKPGIKSMPSVMEFIRQARLKQNVSTSLKDTYSPVLSNGKYIQYATPEDENIGRILNQQFRYWGGEKPVSYFKDVAVSQNSQTTGNVIIDVINAMLGTNGLFDMCKNSDIHPLAQLSSLGRGLIEHSIRSFGVAFGVGILSILDKQNFAQSLSAATSFFTTFATLGLGLGFILYYVIPFLPFIYFFFAVMTWVKGIFEAMVGVPLWALGHLRIDGEGMPGGGGEAGYFYILEIFLRPVVIIIAFIGGIAVFGAMVKVLNQVFYLLIANLAGHDVNTTSPTGCFNPPTTAGAGGTGGTGAAAAAGVPTEMQYARGTMDEFFFTVIYAIIVYMCALPCFKMVDMVPDNLMRWMGSSIKSYGGLDGDPAQGLMRYISIGTTGIRSKLSGSSLGGFLGGGLRR